MEAHLKTLSSEYLDRIVLTTCIFSEWGSNFNIYIDKEY